MGMPVEEPAGASCDGLTIIKKLAHCPASKEHAKLPSKEVEAEQVAQQMVHVLLGEGCSVQGASAAGLVANWLRLECRQLLRSITGTASADPNFREPQHPNMAWPGLSHQHQYAGNMGTGPGVAGVVSAARICREAQHRMQHSRWLVQQPPAPTCCNQSVHPAGHQVLVRPPPPGRSAQGRQSLCAG